MVAALIQRGEVNLTRWLPYLPCRGHQAQSKQRRVSRWLHNSRINVHRLYKPLIQAALATWNEDCLYLSLDTSMYWDNYCLVRLAVVHRGRALTVVWRVLEHKSASIRFQRLSRAALPRREPIAPRGEGGVAGRPRLCPPQGDADAQSRVGLALSHSSQAQHLALAGW